MADGKNRIMEKLEKRPMSIYDLDGTVKMHQASIRRIIEDLQNKGVVTVVGKKPSKKYRGREINLYGLKK